jgi:hypothetical protein
MKKTAFVFLIFLFLTFDNSAQTTLNEIINDMILPHEGLPHGVPSNFNWQSKPRVGATAPGAGWTAAIAWGQVYEWAGGNTATNTRIQIKDLAMFYLSKKDNNWHLLQSAVSVSGANYVEDFAGDVNKPANIRVEAGGSISTTCGNGNNFHFWPNSGRITIPKDDVAGCFVTVKARLIVNDANLPDDRDKAKYLMSVGGDWWESLTAVWDNWKTNWDIGIGRFRFITSEWKSFNMYSVHADTIRNNPPPFDAVITGSVLPDEAEGIGFKSFTNHDGKLHVTVINPRNERLTLEVYNMNGSRIEILENNFITPGINYYICNNLSRHSGIYIFKLSSTSKIITEEVSIIH